MRASHERGTYEVERSFHAVDGSGQGCVFDTRIGMTISDYDVNAPL